MNYKNTADSLKTAFYEGFDSSNTQAPFPSVDNAWLSSYARKEWGRLMDLHQRSIKEA